MKWRIEPETIEKERNFAGELRWGDKTAVIWGHYGLRNGDASSPNGGKCERRHHQPLRSTHSLQRVARCTWYIVFKCILFLPILDFKNALK